MPSLKSATPISTNSPNSPDQGVKLTASFASYTLQFKFLARTSRESMRVKPTYLLRISDGHRVGVGECALFRGLSCDDRPDYVDKLAQTCRDISRGEMPDLADWPSLRFGVESALADLRDAADPSPWSRGESVIRINGLVWMDSVEVMLANISRKIDAGFRCVKLKIGACDFERELDMLRLIRASFSPEEIEIRVDANGAFTPEEALRKIDALARFSIHSIEQPIRAGQYTEMARICRDSAIPVALDEELIGINTPDEKLRMLQQIRPAYVILKPALCGGFTGADEWIATALEVGADWWATSALESNIGLNAIARWLDTKSPLALCQGLGTGQIYSNNITSPLRLTADRLTSDPAAKWEFPDLSWS